MWNSVLERWYQAAALGDCNSCCRIEFKGRDVCCSCDSRSAAGVTWSRSAPNREQARPWGTARHGGTTNLTGISAHRGQGHLSCYEGTRQALSNSSPACPGPACLEVQSQASVRLWGESLQHTHTFIHTFTQSHEGFAWFRYGEKRNNSSLLW